MPSAFIQFATTDNAFFKPLEVPLPLTHAALLDVAKKKFKSVTNQSRLFDGVNGEEVSAGAVGVELAAGAKIVVSGKAGWKGSQRLRAAFAAEALTAADAANVRAADGESSDPGARKGGELSSPSARTPPLRLQLVSFGYDRGQPHDTAANVNARGLPNPGPGKAAMGRIGLEK